MTKIRKDIIGIYARIGGWICRPYSRKDWYRGYTNGVKCTKTGGTQFKEGDTVRSSHPGGSIAFVRSGKRGTSDFTEEHWSVFEPVELYNKYDPNIELSYKTFPRA